MWIYLVDKNILNKYLEEFVPIESNEIYININKKIALFNLIENSEDEINEGSKIKKWIEFILKTNLFKDKRGHVWKKSKRAFNFTDSLNFKPYGRIETLEGICPHINSGNHTCEFCKFVWSVVKKKKRCVEKNISV